MNLVRPLITSKTDFIHDQFHPNDTVRAMSHIQQLRFVCEKNWMKAEKKVKSALVCWFRIIDTIPLMRHSFGFSSEASWQSFSPSQANDICMQEPSPHWNWWPLHGTGSNLCNLSKNKIQKSKEWKMWANSMENSQHHRWLFEKP